MKCFSDEIVVSDSEVPDVMGRLFCPSDSNNVTCWPRTAAGLLAVARCPAVVNDVPYTGNATRACLPNGTWQPWSNYSECRPFVRDIDSSMHSAITGYIYYIGFTTSIVALAVALFIFVYFRSLRCLRNTIHCHLIVAFILKNLLWITMYSGLPRLMAYEEQNYSVVLQWTCKVIVMLFNYLQLTSFCWMLVEGLYLHTLVVWAYSAAKIRLWYYVVIGWVVPWIFILAWAIAKANLDDTSCWLPPPVPTSHLDFIYITPILVVLLLNLIFLGTIIWVLVTKLRDSNSLQTVQYRKAVKATVVLFPLLGAIYVLFIASPSDHVVSKRVFVYFNSVLQSTQGLLVAVFYCFLNGEVRMAVRSKAGKWKDDHSGSTRYIRASFTTHAEPIDLRPVNNPPETST